MRAGTIGRHDRETSTLPGLVGNTLDRIAMVPLHEANAVPPPTLGVVGVHGRHREARALLRTSHVIRS